MPGVPTPSILPPPCSGRANRGPAEPLCPPQPPLGPQLWGGGVGSSTAAPPPHGSSLPFTHCLNGVRGGSCPRRPKPPPHVPPPLMPVLWEKGGGGEVTPKAERMKSCWGLGQRSCGSALLRPPPSSPLSVGLSCAPPEPLWARGGQRAAILFLFIGGGRGAEGALPPAMKGELGGGGGRTINRHQTKMCRFVFGFVLGFVFFFFFFKG